MHLKKETGFTLIELMVALAINAVLFTALLSVFTGNIAHYSKSINTNLLSQQLQSALNFMTNDIRRAGYWANASNDVNTGQNNNPFMTSDTDVALGNSNSCILFAYDASNNGTLPSISSAYDDERYGYRLNNGALQSRPTGATFSCDAANTAWENVTDTNIVTITGLTFTLTQRTITTDSGKAIVLRSVGISISGRLVSNSAITKTMTEHIRIRNDKYTP